jgi:uncharacterized protein (TIGR02611 family)
MSVLEQETITKCEPASPRTVLPSNWALWFWQQARKIVIFVVGTTVVLLGLAGLLLPVLPGWVLIFAGLVILATEFAWAKWILTMAKQRAADLMVAAKRQVTGRQEGSG